MLDFIPSFLACFTISNILSKLIGCFSASYLFILIIIILYTKFARCITGPSAKGSVNGIPIYHTILIKTVIKKLPTSITSAPPFSRDFMIGIVFDKLGYPAVIKATKVALPLILV